MSVTHRSLARCGLGSPSRVLLARKISQAKQREYNPGSVRREIKRFDGEHTFNHTKNTITLLMEAKAMTVMPVLFGGMAGTKYFLYDSLPLWVDSWAFTGCFSLFALVLGRYVAMGKRNKLTKDLTGKRVVITGATGGIGLPTAIQLAQMGAHIHVLSRRGPHVDAAMAAIKGAAVHPPAAQQIQFTCVDFADLVAVRDVCRSMRGERHGIDFLINNAAVLKVTPSTTRFGEDEMLVINLLSPYLLTEGLLPLVEKVGGRIVNVGSSSHVAVTTQAVQKYLSGRGVWSEKKVGRKFDGLEQYGFTKLGVMFHAQELAARSYPPTPKLATQSRQVQAAVARGEQRMAAPTSQEPKYTVCSLNPGGVITSIYRDVPMAWLFNTFYYFFTLLLKTPYDGSQTVVNCCLRDQLVNGGYYMECKYLPTALSKTACDIKERTAVMEWVRQKMIPYMKWE